MSTSRHREAACAALCALLGSTPLLRAQQEPPREPISPLFSAWLTEHLRRDPALTREAFERAATDPGELPERRVVAAARLVEIDRVVGDAEALDRHDQLVRTALDSDPETPRVSTADFPRDALRTALELPPGPEREAALTTARQALDAAQENTRITNRFYVGYVVRRYDAERQRIEREIATARSEGNTARINELRDRLRPTRGNWREADVDRARAWRVRVVNLLAEGRFELAELLLARFPTSAEPGPPDQRLARALERVDLHLLERNALENLAVHVRAWKAAGSNEAQRALALLPY